MAKEKMGKYVISKRDIILLLCLSILISGVLDNIIHPNLRLIIVIVILVIIINPFPLFKKTKEALNTWEDLNDGTIFKILKIGTTFDKSTSPSRKTGYLEIQIKGVKKILIIFPTHISCWEGIIPIEGKSYKKDGNYFTEIKKS